jgi:hypothetical protein
MKKDIKFKDLIAICKKQSVSPAIMDSETKILETAEELGYVFNLDYEFVGEENSTVLIDGIILKNKKDHFLRITRIFRSTKYEIDNQKTQFCLDCPSTDDVTSFMKNYINY